MSKQGTRKGVLSAWDGLHVLTMTDQNLIERCRIMERSKRTRKNITVAEVIADINRQLALPEEAMSEEEKKGLCGFAEHLLLSTNNYAGYTNVDWQNGGCKAWREAGEPNFPEKQKFIGREYSREYYIK